MYGIQVENVVEILEFVPLKSKPESLPYILGLIEHRDQVIPLIDTGVKFGQDKIDINENTCIVVVNVEKDDNQGDFQVAVVADQVTDVIEASAESIKTIENSYKPGYIAGALKQNDNYVLVMNVDKIFSDTDILVIDKIVKEIKE